MGTGQIKKFYDESTQTLVSEKQRSLTDNDTGEVIIVDQITKLNYGSKKFWKCYLMDFMTILGIIDNKQVDIFIYIVENTNPSTNIFMGTYSKIAKDLNVSRPTIAKIMKKLQQNNFIKKIQNGAWFVNPNILMKGNDQKRQILLTYYNAEEPIEKMTFSRTAREEIKVEGEEEWTEQPKLLTEQK